MEENKTKNKFLIPLVIVGIAILLIIFAILLSSTTNKAKDILDDLGIDDYFKYVLTTDYKKDTNLSQHSVLSSIVK